MLHCLEHLSYAYCRFGLPFGKCFFDLAFLAKPGERRLLHWGFSLAGPNRYCNPTAAPLIIMIILIFILSILIILIIPTILIILIIFINLINIKRLALFVTCSQWWLAWQQLQKTAWDRCCIPTSPCCSPFTITSLPQRCYLSYFHPGLKFHPLLAHFCGAIVVDIPWHTPCWPCGHAMLCCWCTFLTHSRPIHLGHLSSMFPMIKGFVCRTATTVYWSCIIYSSKNVGVCSPLLSRPKTLFSMVFLRVFQCISMALLHGFSRVQLWQSKLANLDADHAGGCRWNTGTVKWDEWRSNEINSATFAISQPSTVGHFFICFLYLLWVTVVQTY